MMNKKLTDKTKIKERIKYLEKQSQIVRGELEDELENTGKSVAHIGKIALGVGGGLVLSALILRAISGTRGRRSNAEGKKRSKRVYQRFMDQLYGELSYHSTRFLLNFAKDLLNPQTIKKDNAEEVDSGIPD